jgi:hypothetical protein
VNPAVYRVEFTDGTLEILSDLQLSLALQNVIVLCCTEFSDSITTKVSPYTMGCNVASVELFRTTASDYLYNHPGADDLSGIRLQVI